MTDLNIAELKAAAEAATPGPWIWIAEKGVTLERLIQITAPTERAQQICDFGDRSQYYPTEGEASCCYDQNYIAAANPQTVLCLISRLEKAEAHGRNQGLDEAAKVASDCYLKSRAAPDTPSQTYDNARHESGQIISTAILALKTTEGET